MPPLGRSARGPHPAGTPSAPRAARTCPHRPSIHEGSGAVDGTSRGASGKRGRRENATSASSLLNHPGIRAGVGFSPTPKSIRSKRETGLEPATFSLGSCGPDLQVIVKQWLRCKPEAPSSGSHSSSPPAAESQDLADLVRRWPGLPERLRVAIIQLSLLSDPHDQSRIYQHRAESRRDAQGQASPCLSRCQSGIDWPIWRK